MNEVVSVRIFKVGADGHIHQPIRTGIMKLMLLRVAVRRASHSETSHSLLREPGLCK